MKKILFLVVAVITILALVMFSSCKPGEVVTETETAEETTEEEATGEEETAVEEEVAEGIAGFEETAAAVRPAGRLRDDTRCSGLTPAKCCYGGCLALYSLLWRLQAVPRCVWVGVGARCLPRVRRSARRESRAT